MIAFLFGALYGALAGSIATLALLLLMSTRARRHAPELAASSCGQCGGHNPRCVACLGAK